MLGKPLLKVIWDNLIELIYVYLAQQIVCRLMGARREYRMSLSGNSSTVVCQASKQMQERLAKIALQFGEGQYLGL